MYQDKSLVELLPGAGFSTKFSNTNFFAGIHRGFTPPSSGTLKILNFGAGLDDQGLNLEAEKSWNKEIGIRGNYSMINFEMSGFHVGIENLVAAGRGTAFKNLGKVSSMGLELNLNLLSSKAVGLLPDFHFIYAFLKTEINEGIIKSNVTGTVGSDVSIKGTFACSLTAFGS